MKNSVYITITLLLMSCSGLARIGCMDNSYHLSRRNDPKEYHYVRCNCPCEKVYPMLKDGTCTKCKHRKQDTFVYQEPTVTPQIIDVAKLQQYAGKKIARNYRNAQ